MILTASIDLTLIDKDKIVSKTRKNGQPAKFYNLTLFINDDGQVDQYGQSGTIKESISLDERNAGVKPTILGNLKIVGNKPRLTEAPAPSSRNDEDDQIPF
jgi:hypothetical protein